MLKKTVTYKNIFTDEDETKDLYFHLSKAELIEMELSVKGGLEDQLKEIISTEEISIIYPEFKKWVLLAYGERSSDGKTFIKSEEISQAFTQTEAYSEFLLWLMSDTSSLIEFINGIVPGGLTEDQISEAKKLVEGDEKDMPVDDEGDETEPDQIEPVLDVDKENAEKVQPLN